MTLVEEDQAVQLIKPSIRGEREDYFPIRDGNGKFILFLTGTGRDGTGNGIVNLRLIF